jgi:hypothetical protein
MKFLRRDSRDGWYEIDPKDAQELLTAARRNRPLSEWRAQRLSGQMLANQWRENGEPLIFDPKGRLLDGQHRLRGVILTNRAVVFYCVFNVPEHFFATMDQGASRNGAHLASLMGFENAFLVAGLVRLAIMHGKGKLGVTGKGKVAGEEMRLYLKNHTEPVAESAKLISKCKGLVRLVPMSHMAFLHYLTRTHPRAMVFLDQIANGTDLHKGDAVLVFRQRMQAMQGEKHKFREDEILALLIKAWNAFLAKKPISLLRWSPEETFPTIDGITER